MFRLSQKHSQNLGREIAAVNAEKLIAAQSVRAAVAGAAIAIIIGNILWAYTASISGKYFPWISIVQGTITGIAVQKSGRGLDYRFPAIAGAAAWIGAFSGNLVIALLFTTAETGSVDGNWRQIVRAFFENTVSVIDIIYAFCAVAVAIFFSKKRLNRFEVLALRKYVGGKE
jgi:hypothetical protein